MPLKSGIRFDSPQSAARSVVVLPNISFLLAEKLATIGITQPSQLREVGALAAWKKLRSSRGVPADSRILFALEGAVEGVPWQRLPPSVRRRLESQAAM